jgi:peptidoglycan/xylan/chitin deacetylase (PgdA/CDA1 family)
MGGRGLGAIRDRLGGLKAAVLSRVAARRVDARLAEPACSITFDDVPSSALLNGVPILERYGALATFYVAGGFCEQDGFLTVADLHALAAAGHEIGCHTFSHYGLRSGSAAGLAQDAARNRAAFRETFGLPRARSFSFPYGEVSVVAKRQLAGYASLRSVYAGVNGRGTDLLMLRANAIFSRTMDWDAVRRLAGRAKADRAWILFYTHGVSRDPDEWSCLPEHLDRVLALCRSAGLRFRTVGDVARELRAGPVR